MIINAKTSGAEAEGVAREIRDAGGKAVAQLADVGTPEGAAALVGAALASFGRLDILVNNAAVRREMDFERLDYQEWREIMATILDGAYSPRMPRCPTWLPPRAAPSSTSGAVVLHRRGAPGPCHCRQSGPRRPDARAGARPRAALYYRELRRARPDRYRAAGARALAPRVARDAGRAPRNAGGDRRGRPVSVRSRRPLHHRADAARQRRRIYGIADGSRKVSGDRYQVSGVVQIPIAR